MPPWRKILRVRAVPGEREEGLNTRPRGPEDRESGVPSGCRHQSASAKYGHKEEDTMRCVVQCGAENGGKRQNGGERQTRSTKPKPRVLERRDELRRGLCVEGDGDPVVVPASHPFAGAGCSIVGVDARVCAAGNQPMRGVQQQHAGGRPQNGHRERGNNADVQSCVQSTQGFIVAPSRARGSHDNHGACGVRAASMREAACHWRSVGRSGFQAVARDPVSQC